MPYPATFRSTRAFGPIGCAICARVIRADGVIVKPDDAIAPLDASCIEQANDRRLPIVAAAPKSRSRHTFFCLRSLGRTPHGTFLALGVGSQRSRLCLQLLRRIRNAPPAGGCGKIAVPDDGAYWIVVPVGPSGVGFLDGKDAVMTTSHSL